MRSHPRITDHAAFGATSFGATLFAALASLAISGPSAHGHEGSIPVAGERPPECAVAENGHLANEPNPSAIRLRSIKGITQRFPLFFETPSPDDPTQAPPEAVVVVLMSPGCPVVNQYIEKLRQLHYKYNYTDRQIVRKRNFLVTTRPDGSLDTDFVYPGDRVQFLGVHPIPNTNVKDIARHAVEKDIPFRVLHDPQQTFIQQYGELVDDRKQVILSQVLVFDRQMKLVYSGAINDQHAPGAAAQPQNTSSWNRPSTASCTESHFNCLPGNGPLRSLRVASSNCSKRRRPPAPTSPGMNISSRC